MLSRLWLLLLCALTLAPLPLPAAARPSGVAVEAATQSEQPTVEADFGPLSSRFRAAERAEVPTVVARVLLMGVVSPRDAEQHVAPGHASRGCRPTSWTDLVQCRRSTGEQLLRYATPPPARA